MAYANSIILYGWTNDDAKETVAKLFNLESVPEPVVATKTKGKSVAKPAVPISSYSNNEYFKGLSKDDDLKIVDKINKRLKDEKFDMKFGIFEGGISSDEYMCYLTFNGSKENQSCDSDDISEKSFTIKEIKKFLDDSFKFSKDHPNIVIKQPKLIHLTVSDSK
jgi:hypothetical protein